MFENNGLINARLDEVDGFKVYTVDNFFKNPHDILDLLREFKATRARDENIKVKLKGFKKAYQLENTDETLNKVTFEHYYDAAKRQTVKREVFVEEKNKE